MDAERKDRGSRGVVLLAALLCGGVADAHELVGRVTDERTGAVVAGMRITAACLGACNSHVNTRTTVSGEFRLSGVLPGDYVVRADEHRGYRSTVWPAGHCSDYIGPACLEDDAVRIVTVPENEETTRLDFVVEPFALVEVVALDALTLEPPYEGASGRVTLHGADQPIAEPGASLAYAEGGIPVTAGRYRVSAGAALYTRTFYPDVPCPNPCANDVGHVIEVQSGERLKLVVKLVPAYGLIRGRVVDALDGTPLEAATVAAGSRIARTDTHGEYALRVPSGPAWLAAHRMPTHANSPYRSGGLSVPNTGEISGVDFSLARTGSISGSVRSTSGSVLADVQVVAASTAGSSSATSDGSGRFVLRVPPGTYTVFARASAFLSQSYRDGACVPTCATATPIVIAPGSARDGVDFMLEPGAAITGRLLAADSPRLSGEVRVYRETGEHVSTVVAALWQDFTTSLLRAGRYRLVATVEGYAPTAWPDVQCPEIEGCASFGASIEIAAAPYPVEVTLRMQRPPRGEVVVRALDEITGEELEPVRFDEPSYEFVSRGEFYPRFVRHGALVSHAIATCRLVGFDRACLLPEGEYRLLVAAPSYGDIRWPDVACEGNACSADAGRSFVVRAGESRLLTATLRRYGRLGGAVRGAGGWTLSAYSVEVFDGAGRRVVSLPGVAYGSFDTGFVTNYTGELPPGRYFVHTRNPIAFLDQLHAGLPCPDGACDPLAGSPVEIGGHVDTPLEFNLGESQRLFQTGFE